ncbi:hypothetical protein PSU4_29750 [Pseudonocardia sulfidoxydans NBRC 16205]|uniref:RNA polymerase sigma factor ShbA n=1 Tax=Pseudonocardia sulfidoxydans NBRC 16205 TaxID=1223511 RepID=A0A511DGW1_9PSEU|nr:hypothetical protein PSU4_29750 [Pseudonocardia sulfidoxydans NBRC 16205]
MTTAAAAPLPLLDAHVVDADILGPDTFGPDALGPVIAVSIPAPRAPEPDRVSVVVPDTVTDAVTDDAVTDAVTDDAVTDAVTDDAVTDAVADDAVTDDGVTDAADDEPHGPAEMIEALVGDAVGGDTRARDALLSVIHPMVLRYCRARLGRQECVVGAAEDVAQDVCLAVVRALPNYTVKGLSFRAFVYGIAAHKVTDAFRAIGRNRSEPVPDVPDSVSGAEGPEHRALAVELGERLGELLHTLTPRQREVIVLRVAVGLSAEETAHAVGSTPGAVRVTQHRALTRLRQVLVEHEAAATVAGSPLGRAVAAAAAEPGVEGEPDFRVG